MHFPLRTFQRHTKELLLIINDNPNELIAVADGRRQTVFYVISAKSDSDYVHSISNKAVHSAEMGPVHVTDQITSHKQCELCNGTVQLYELWEDGEERIVCSTCITAKYGKLAKSILKRSKQLT